MPGVQVICRSMSSATSKSFPVMPPALWVESATATLGRLCDGYVAMLRAEGKPSADKVEASLRLLHPLLTVTASTEDAAEGIAAFQEKRSPQWKGR